ncbi:MAG: hypothetical protein KME64_29125 [Scytonematopsis contorta HA4267-MV1]|jgi:hypothetical protein|nr:hypothetical protein [Scytonematopsis contorta HA4267-MV1]
MATQAKVGLEVVKGYLRVRLPRYISNTRYINTGLTNTLQNLTFIQKLVSYIDRDIADGCFDSSLAIYKEYLSKPKVSDITLLELWDKFCSYKQPQVAYTTFNKDYLVKYRNHILKLPCVSPTRNSAIANRDYLITNVSLDTCKRIIKYLSSCCSWSVKSGLIGNDYYKDLIPESRRHKEKKLILPFSYF